MGIVGEKMSALHKLCLIGLKESEADKEKGRGEEREEKGKKCVVTAQKKEICRFMFFKLVNRNMGGGVLLFYSNTGSH